MENKKFIEVSDVFSNKELKNGFIKQESMEVVISELVEKDVVVFL